MYRLVLHTSLGVLLVYRQPFYCELTAKQTHEEKYPLFPGLEIWKQWEVDNYQGGPVVQFSEKGEVVEYA